MLTLFGPLNLVSKMTGWFLIVVCIGLFITLKVERRALAKAKVQITKLVQAREADRRAYEAAQVKAAEMNKQVVQRIETQQQRITANEKASYQRDLAHLRSELNKRLRQQNAPAKGSADNANPSGVSPAPSGVDGSARVSIPTDLYVRGAELELQLERLQRWINGQLSIPRNPEAK